MKTKDSLIRVAKWTLSGIFILFGTVFGFLFASAFQTSWTAPSSVGTANSNNDSRSYPFFTTSPSNVFDRATMSFEAVKNNFATLISDTTAIKNNFNTINTRVSGQQCVAWSGMTDTSCPSGWTYTSQLNIWSSKKTNLCCK